MAFFGAAIKIVLTLFLCVWVVVLASSEHAVNYTEPNNNSSIHVDKNTTDDKHVKDTDQHDKHAGNPDHDNNTGHHKVHGVEIAEWKFSELREHFIFTVVVLLAGLSKVGFHYTDKLASLVPESCLLIIIGTLFGAIFLLTGISEKLPEFFTPDAFFHFLLPPIILEAAFSLYDRTFLQNLGSILIFSVIGTCFAAFTIGVCLIGLHSVGAMENINVTPIQLLVFSSLIVAVDPVAVLAVFNEVGVNRVLYFLVFGESLLNDGVTVVLYNVLQSYNSIALGGGSITAKEIFLGIVKFLVVCFGGLCIGAIVGVLSSVLTKYTVKVKVVEPVAIFGMAYLAFIMAEMFHFSGIISIIACGLIQVAYAFNNLNRKSCTAIKYFTRVMSSTTEIIIFMFLGLLLVRKDHHWETGFILWTLFLCIIVRFFYTYLFSFMINTFDNTRVRRIGMDEMFIMSYGGLRGAVCFSLVALLKKEDFPTKDLFITTTLVVILFTVFVQGSTIKPLVNKLRVKLATEVEPKMYDELNTKVTDHLMAGMEEVVGHEGNFYLMEKMRRIHDLYLRKYLLKDSNMIDQLELIQYYEKLVIKEHYKNLDLCGATLKTMTEKAQSMRKIDSSAILMKLASGADVEEPEQEPEVKLRIKKKDSPTPSDFRRMLESHASFSRMLPQAMYDRNMARPSKFSMMQQLQNKRNSNNRLQRMKSIRVMPQRALSWCEDDSEICYQRETDVKHRPKQRSATVDISPTSPERINVLSFDSQMMDTVFEEDETEAKPLLSKEGQTEAKPSLSNKGPIQNDGKGVTIIPTGVLGDTICLETSQPVCSNQPINEQAKVSVITTDDHDIDDSKLDKHTTRKNSGHHILTRQGAMEDIPMKKMNRSNSQ